MKTTDTKIIDDTLRRLGACTTILWRYQASHAFVHLLILAEDGVKYHLLLNRCNIEAASSGGRWDLRVSAQESEVCIFSTGGEFRATGTSAVLTDERPATPPAYPAVMRVLLRLIDIARSLPQDSPQVAVALKTVETVTAWLSNESLPEIEFREAIVSLTERHPSFSPILEALQKEVVLHEPN